MLRTNCLRFLFLHTAPKTKIITRKVNKTETFLKIKKTFDELRPAGLGQ